MPPDDEQLIRAVVDVIRDTFRLALKPTSFLSDKHLSSSRDSNNPTRQMDRIAQDNLKLHLDVLFEKKILFVAEEPESSDYRIPDDLAKSQVDVAVLDPIDGTDLWAKGFSNWCISVAIFEPKRERIRASFVGYSSGDIFWASERGAFRHSLDGRNYPLTVARNENLRLMDATVCFYGQKPANFLAVQENLSISRMLRSVQDQKELAQKLGDDVPQFRIYNLAGNPMMVRMTSSEGVEAAVDVVFELKGQKAFDVVPGAFIAKQAGAFIVDLENNEIDLHKALRNHKTKMTYILGASRALVSDMWISLTGGRHKNIKNRTD
jgi:fructose-1,6-bisphosphatase/inositol monophosphatase family enzyme